MKLRNKVDIFSHEQSMFYEKILEVDLLNIREQSQRGHLKS